MTKTFHEHVCGILRAFYIEKFNLLVPDELVDAFVANVNMFVVMFCHRV